MSNSREAAFLLFLDNMFIDAEDSSRKIDEKPGFGTYDEKALLDEDRIVLRYSEDAHTHPFWLDSESHGVAYSIAMNTLFQLRVYWKDSYIESSDGDPLPSMQADIEAVINHLNKVSAALRNLEQPQQGLIHSANIALTDLRKAMAKTEMLVREAQQQVKIKTDAKKLQDSYVTLSKLLNATPVELLAQAQITGAK